MSQSISYWSSHFHMPEIPSLENDHECEVAVIGAGIAGLSAAYLLLKEGKSVTVLTDGSIAEGQTSRTTAHLTYMLDDRFFELEKLFGTEGLKKALKSHKDAVDLIEKICKEEHIACDFERVDSHLFNPPECPADILHKEYTAALRAGIQEARLENSPFPFFNSHEMLTFPNQGQFHPLKYLRGLSQSIQKLGGKIYKNAHIVEVSGGNSCKARTDKNFQISCRYIIVSTNTPINNRFVIHTKQAAYRTYVIAAYIPKGAIPKGLFYDTLDPYHYVRIYSEEREDLLIIGGEDHKTGQEEHPHSCYQRLEKWARERFPMIKSIAYSWSGQILEPVDSLAFIGKNPLENNVFIVTGDSGNGLTHGTLSGLINCDLIMGRHSPYAALYDPARKTLYSATEFAKENLNVGAQYTQWLRSSEATLKDEIPKNSGKIVQKKMQKLAIYRDEKGDYFAFSAVCPHLGCVINWNDTEKTWDCPCHGSRFECKGKVICGPAISNLKNKPLT